jgi:hypothetical protein
MPRGPHPKRHGSPAGSGSRNGEAETPPRFSLSACAGALHHVTAISGPRAGEPRLLRRRARHAAGQEERQPGRPRHLPPLLRRRRGHARHDLTFFPWAQMAPRGDGHGLALEVALAVPPGTLDWWGARLERYGVEGRRARDAASASACCRSSIRTACGWRWSRARAPRAPSSRGTAARCRPSGRSAASNGRALGSATRHDHGVPDRARWASRPGRARRLGALWRAPTAALRAAVDLRATPDDAGAAPGASAPSTTSPGASTTSTS